MLLTHHNVLRDFHEELAQILDLKDPGFVPSSTALWHDHLPTVDEATCNAAMDNADKQLTKLKADQDDSCFQADCLKLARDCAMLGRIYDAESKSARSSRMKKVTHINEQNTIGANLVSNFMESNAQFVHAEGTFVESKIVEARRRCEQRLKAALTAILIITSQSFMRGNTSVF